MTSDDEKRLQSIQEDAVERWIDPRVVFLLRLLDEAQEREAKVQELIHAVRQLGHSYGGVSATWDRTRAAVSALAASPAEKPKPSGRTFENGGVVYCDECCNGDRCDDPTHRQREGCPYCLGTGVIKPPTESGRGGDEMSDPSKHGVNCLAAMNYINAVTGKQYECSCGVQPSSAASEISNRLEQIELGDILEFLFEQQLTPRKALEAIHERVAGNEPLLPDKIVRPASAASKPMSVREWLRVYSCSDWYVAMEAYAAYREAPLLEQLAAKDAKIERLRDAVPHPGDGSCDHCGRVPAVDIPTSLCNECRDGVKRAEAAEAELATLKSRLDDSRTNADHLRKRKEYYKARALRAEAQVTSDIDLINRKSHKITKLGCIIKALRAAIAVLKRS